ncbi:MAG: hypothetical protein IPO93_16085 [Actinobacteria bacterium]|nr:hypothetical protein [Actinomycetota bacterium]
MGVKTFKVPGLVGGRVQVGGFTRAGVDGRCQFRRVGFGFGAFSSRDESRTANRGPVHVPGFGIAVGRIAHEFLELQGDALGHRELDIELGADDFGRATPRLVEPNDLYSDVVERVGLQAVPGGHAGACDRERMVSPEAPTSMSDAGSGHSSMSRSMTRTVSPPWGRFVRRACKSRS